jgi:hypothetical protein
MVEAIVQQQISRAFVQIHMYSIVLKDLADIDGFLLLAEA